VTSYLASRGCNILDSAQFLDDGNKRFFMRVHASWKRAGEKEALEGLEKDFRLEIAENMGMEFGLVGDGGGVKTMIMVSKIGRE